MAWTPTRQQLPKPEPRADLAENLSRVYDALWRRARHTHRALIDTTWNQLAIAVGYPPGQRAATQLRRYLELFAEAGLIAFGGHRDPSGRWRYLDVELVEPPSLVSRAPAGVAQSVEATVLVCDGRRRHETRKQRAARRRQPWRRCGGRPDTVERRTLSWRSTNVHSLTEGGGRTPVRGFPPPVSDAHDARGRVGDARSSVDAPHGGAGPSAPAAPNGHQDRPPPTSAAPPTPTAAGEKEQRAARRRARRAAARRRRWPERTAADLRDGRLIPRAELELYRDAAGDADAERGLFGRYADLLPFIPKEGQQ